MIKAIDWNKGESPFKSDFDESTFCFEDHTVVRRADERDYEILLDFIRFFIEEGEEGNTSVSYISPVLRQSGITSGSAVPPGQLELFLRQSFFSFSHLFYILERQGKTIGLISLLRSPQGHCSISVGLLFLLDNKQLEKAIDFFLDAVSQDDLIRSISATQIRLSIKENDQNNVELENVIKQRDFEKVAVLPDEFGEDTAELIYTRKITFS